MNCTMDDVRGHFLRPPHAEVMANKVKSEFISDCDPTRPVINSNIYNNTPMQYTEIFSRL